jgi:hypothetical protein
VQANLGRHVRPVVDGQHVEAARTVAHVPVAEKSSRRSHHHALLSVVTLNSRSAVIASLTVRVRTSTNARVFPS